MGGFQPLSILISAAKIPVESSGNRLLPLIAEPINRRPYDCHFRRLLARSCVQLRHSPRPAHS
jgi:hypothetical protein